MAAPRRHSARGRSSTVGGPQQLDLFADTPRLAYDPQLDEARLEEKLADTRRKVRKFTIGAMRPNLSAGARKLAVNMRDRRARN